MPTIDGVLVRLKISRFANSKQDKSLTETVSEDHNLGEGAGRWVKTKLPKEALQSINSLLNKVRDWHYANTLPWDDGVQLLTSRKLAEYETDIARSRSELIGLVDEMLKDYNSWIDKAKTIHNGTFSESDYPSRQEMREMFGIKIEFLPVPESGHLSKLVTQLTGDRVSKIQAELETQNARRLNEAIHDVWGRVLSPLIHMTEKLVGDNVVFRESLVENVREVAELVPGLNITNDPRLNAMAEEIKTMLAGVTSEKLKGSQLLSSTTASKAVQIITKYGEYGSRKFA